MMLCLHYARAPAFFFDDDTLSGFAFRLRLHTELRQFWRALDEDMSRFGGPFFNWYLNGALGMMSWHAANTTG